MIELYCLNEEKLDSVMQKGVIDGPFSVDINYVLLLDKLPVVFYIVLLQKYNGVAKGIWSAEVQYENVFTRADKSPEEKEKYLQKGYTRQGLELLTSKLLSYPVPFIHLDIHPNNIGSIKVAEGCGYKKKGNSYYKYHSDILDLLYNSLGENFTEEQKRGIIEKFRLVYEQEISSPTRL